jgi:hypothetical protein
MTETERLIREWMQAEGLPEAFYDQAASACTIPVGGGAELSLFGLPESGDVFIAVDLMSVDAVRGLRAELFALCMEMNAYAVETRGGAIGFDARREKLVLTARIAADRLDAPLLARMTNDLLDAAVRLRRRLEERAENRLRELETRTDRNDPVLLMG